MSVKFAMHYLVSTVLQKGVKVGGVILGARGQRGPGEGNIDFDEVSVDPPEVGLNCQNFRHVVVREYVTIRTPVGDGTVDKSNESTTTASGQVIAPVCGIACEPLEGWSSRRVWSLAHRLPTLGDGEGRPAVLLSSAECYCSWTAGTWLSHRQLLERQCLSEQVSWVWWRVTDEKGSLRTGGLYAIAPYPMTLPIWRVLHGGTGVEHVGQLNGASRC